MSRWRVFLAVGLALALGLGLAMSGSASSGGRQGVALTRNARPLAAVAAADPCAEFPKTLQSAGDGKTVWGTDGSAYPNTAVAVSPYPGWGSPIGTSSWVSTDANRDEPDPTYYQQSFNVSQYTLDFATLTLSGSFLADNNAAVSFNSVAGPATSDSASSNFAGPATAFTYTSTTSPNPFKTNDSLAFKVGNTGSVGGLDYAATVTCTPNYPDLTIVKKLISPTPWVVGGTYTFQTVVTNLGPGTVPAGAAIYSSENPLPAGLTEVSTNPTAGCPQNVTGTGSLGVSCQTVLTSPLTPNGTVTITWTVHVDSLPPARKFTNCVVTAGQVTPTSGVLPEVTQTNNNFCVDIPVEAPDVAVTPWLTPPANTWETTDIWVDSPLPYGYQSGSQPCVGASCPAYKYGAEQSTYGDWVPAGNGDDPITTSTGAGGTNYIYVRVRNLGTAAVPAGTTVHVERSNPEGMGILGSVSTTPGPGGPGWVLIGTVQLPNAIPVGPDAYEDVSVAYTPTPPTAADWAAQNASGSASNFFRHTCLHVWVDLVPGDPNANNQVAYENLQYYHADIIVGNDTPNNNYNDTFTLRNTDRRPRSFTVSLKSNLPAGWKVALNNGRLDLTLKGGETRRLPIVITPRPASPKTKPGTTYTLDVSAHYKGQNLTAKPLGGVRIEVIVVRHVKITCSAKRSKTPSGREQIRVTGQLQPSPQDKRLLVEIGAVHSKPFHVIAPMTRLVHINPRGGFAGVLPAQAKTSADNAFCLFGGTKTLATAASPLLPIG